MKINFKWKKKRNVEPNHRRYTILYIIKRCLYTPSNRYQFFFPLSFVLVFALSFPLPLFLYTNINSVYVFFFFFFFHSPFALFFLSRKRSKWFVYLHRMKKKTGHHLEFKIEGKRLCVCVCWFGLFGIPFETVRSVQAAQKFRMFNYPYERRQKKKKTEQSWHTTIPFK